MTDLESYFSDVQNKRRRRRTYIALSAFIGTVYALILGIGLLLFRSPLVGVNDIRIEGATEVTPMQIMDMVLIKMRWPQNRWGFLGFRNILAWPKQLSGDDLKLLPSVKDIRIEKSFRKHSVTLSVIERKAVGIWCVMKREPTTCFWFDQEGVMFRNTWAAEGSLISVVNDYSQGDLGINDVILQKEFIPHLIGILKVLPESNVAVKEIKLVDLSLQEVEVSTFDGPTIFFSMRFPPSEVVGVLNSLREQPGLEKLESIYFRVEGRVYYK